METLTEIKWDEFEERKRDLEKRIYKLDEQKKKFQDYLISWNLYLDNIMWEINCMLWRIKFERDDLLNKLELLWVKEKK